MANATAAVQSFVSSYIDGLVLKTDLDTTVQDYFPMSMVGLNAAGNLVYCDDTQDILFLGLVSDSVTVSVLTGDLVGTRKINVIRPRFYSMAITGAAKTNVGMPVYAQFNNAVQYSTGTYGNLCGYVVAFRSATEVLIAPPPFNALRGGNGAYRGAKTLAATGAVTLTAIMLNKTIYVTNTAAQTITLPAVANTVQGDRLKFKKTTGGTFTATLAGNAAENIDGANTSATMTANNKFVEIESDGTQWWILTSN